MLTHKHQPEERQETFRSGLQGWSVVSFLSVFLENQQWSPDCEGPLDEPPYVENKRDQAAFRHEVRQVPLPRLLEDHSR